MPHNVKARMHGLLYDLYGIRQEKGSAHIYRVFLSLKQGSAIEDPS